MDAHQLGYRAGCGLPQEFYLSQRIFEEEQRRIFRQGWFFAGHSVELPEPGAYLTLNVGGMPVIVVRDGNGELWANHNVCRHRGSIICTEEHGKTSLFVCPYHAWSYAHDGRLSVAPMMPDDFDKGGYRLGRGHAEEFDGLIFVSLAAAPTPIAELCDHLSPILRSQGLARAKIAAIRDYHLDVNWKIVVENNRECYHCVANHQGYVAIHYDTENENPALADEIAGRLAECTSRWAKLGLDVGRVNTLSDTTAAWFRANRTPLRKGMVTESVDGQPVCRVLMGGFTEPDMGTARANTNINFWCHANSDYANTVRITPVSPTRTVVRSYWLVDETAIERKDYDPERVTAFHDRVMSEDWEICRRQWIGVTSPGFDPGPLSPAKERNLARFIRWYIGQMETRLT